MKIIYKGIKPSETVHRATCNTCSSTMEFQRHEGAIFYDQRDGDTISIECPVCQAKIIVDLNGSVYIAPSYHYTGGRD